MNAAALPTLRVRNLRRVWLRVHRWVALSVGWVLAAVGLMGGILVVAQPLDRWYHGELFQAQPATGATAALEPIRQRLVGEFGNTASFIFRPPREPSDTLWVMVRGGWSGTLYLNPATGQEQGRRSESEGFVNVLFKLHSSLLLQETGKAILAWIALSYLALLVSGLILWWPRRWPPSFKVQLRQGVMRGLFDLHRTGGAIMGLVIAVSVASGAYMAWRPLGEFVTALSGGKPVKPPTLAPAGAGQGAPMALDALVTRAQAVFPKDQIGYIQVSGQANRPLRVRMRLADDPHPNGLTSVWLNPRNGEVLAVQRWNDLDAGARAVSFVYPLHIGELGGPLQMVLTFLSGITLGGLGVTGVWLWWRRRSA